MQRNHAMLLAGLLTTLVLATAGWAASGITASIGVAAVGQAAAPDVESLLSASTAREQKLTAQIREAETAVSLLDASHTRDVQQLQEEIAALAADAEAANAELPRLERQLADLQQALAQEVAAYEQSMIFLQSRDASMQRQVDDALAQLQAAYAEIATRQHGAAGTALSSSTSYGEHEEDDDEHEEGEHEEHEDVEEHHEHDDDD